MDNTYFKEFIDFMLQHKEMQPLPMAETHRTDQKVIGLLRNPDLDTGTNKLHFGNFWPDPVTGRMTVLGEWALGKLQTLGWDPAQDVVIDVNVLQVYKDFLADPNVSEGAKAYWQNLMSQVVDQTTSNQLSDYLISFLVNNYNIDARNIYVVTLSNNPEVFDQVVEWDQNLE